MTREDVWAAGSSYEPYVGRWSRLVAREFLDWLVVDPGKDWIDVGCGTGALTQTIIATASPRSVVGIDQSAAFVGYAEEKTDDARASFRVGDAQALPLEDSGADVAVSGLVLNFVPDAAGALSEMQRVVRPDGLVGVYVWDYADKMELMRYFWDAATDLDPAARELEEGLRFPMCAPGALGELLLNAALNDVEVRAIDVPTRFRDFDDYWTPFLGGQGPAPAYTLSLGKDQRTLLRERLREVLPISADGSIDLTARAWAAKGRRA